MIASHAFFTAMPLMSEPEEAAVADVLADLPVFVAVMRMRSRSMQNVSAATWATLMNNPWPISVPPWFRCTEPSV